MTLRWYHWAAIVGGALWFVQWRKALTLAPGNAEAAGENVSGQSSASGFSSILGNLVNALVNPAPATATAAATSASTPAPSVAPSPLVQSPPSFSAQLAQQAYATVPNTAWYETPNTAA